jgi:hypothetical protein
MTRRAAAHDWQPLPEAVWPVLDEIFDADWYRHQHTDIRWLRTSPEDHYRRRGFNEDRAPGPLFDPSWYRNSSPQAREIGQPALLHFCTADAISRGEPNPLFDSHWISKISGSNENPLLAYAADPSIDPSPMFDTAYFTSRVDVAGGRTPLATYLALDAEADVSPCPLFDTSTYRLAHPEVPRALEHYIWHGGLPGTSPSTRFDGSAYIERSPWVLTGTEPPLVHFLKHGVRERTAWTPIGTLELVRDLLDDREDAAAVFLLRRLRESTTGVRHDGMVATISETRPSKLGPGCVASAHTVITEDRTIFRLSSERSEPEFVVGRDNRAVVAIPHVRRSVAGPASISMTGVRLFDVFNAAQSPVPAILSAMVAPSDLQPMMGIDALALTDEEWITVEGELLVTETVPATVPRRTSRQPKTIQQPLRVTLVDRHETEVRWPAAPDDIEKIRACSALDVDCDVPTSILLLADDCMHAAVRVDRDAPRNDWAEGCKALGIDVEFRPHIRRRPHKERSLTIGGVIPAYNHAGFVGSAIESFLVQEHPISEVVVVDDGSTDETAEIIHSIGDPRVRYMRTERVGPGAALNAGVLTMESDVISFLGSDDLALPHRAEHDLWMLEELDIDAITSLPAIMDEIGDPRGDDAAGFLFPREDPRDPIDVLRLLWRDGNYICNPAVSMRREAYWRFGGSPHGLIHLHDFMLWVRLAGSLRLGGSAERTTAYRRSREALSLSAEGTGSRLQHELEWTFDRFFDTCEPLVFAAVFGAILPATRRSKPSVEIDAIQLFLNHQFDFVRRKGIQKAISALDDQESRRILADDYDLTEQRIFELGSEIDINGLRDKNRLFDIIRNRPPWHGADR